MNKRAYIFLIDGLISLFILGVGFMVITSSSSAQNNDLPISIVSDNAIGFFSEIKISELCNATCSCSNAKLTELCPQIMNKDQSFLDAMGELYIRKKIPVARELFFNITTEKNLIRPEIANVEFRINDTKIYPSYDTETSKSRSKILFSSKRVIFSFYEDTATGGVFFFGPFIAEMQVWEK